MSALSRFVDVRKGERGVLLRAFGALFGLIAGHTILETARDALFLGKLPASRLTFVYVALAALGLVVPSYNMRFVRSFGRRNAVIGTLMLASFGTTLWYFQPAATAVVYGIYLWSGLLGTVMVVQFWMFVAQLFTPSQGRRLFAGVAAGGVLGAVAGGALAAGALAVLPKGGPAPVQQLLLLAAAMFVATAAVLTTLPSEPAPGSSSRAQERPGAALKVLRDEPYVARLALFIAASTATVLLTDYVFKLVAKETVPAAELGEFFAQYYAVLNAVALLMQLFVSLRIVQRFGVVAALCVLPVLLLAGGGSIVFFSGALIAVLVTKGADGALRHSLHRLTTELMYMPLVADVRDRAKSLLDAVFVRGTQALTAGAILGLAALGFGSVRVLGALVVALSALWFVAALRLRGPYLDLFRRHLGRGSIDSQLLEIGDLDIDSVETVMAALSSTDPHRVVAALDLLVEAERRRLVPALILYHPAVEVLLKGLAVIQVGDEALVPHLERLLEHDAPEVRAAAVRKLGAMGALDQMRRACDDDSAIVRAHATFFLVQHDVATGPFQKAGPLQHPELERMLEWAQASAERNLEARVALLDAIAAGGDRTWSEVLLLLAESKSLVLVERLARAMARVRDPRFTRPLIQLLERSDGRADVRAALVAIGDEARVQLVAMLQDDEVSRAIRLQIPRTIAGFADQAAADTLAEWLASHSDGGIRYRSLRGLGRLVASGGVHVDNAAVEEQLVANLREYMRLFTLDAPLATAGQLENQGSRELLRGLLSDKLDQAHERSFRLFQLLHPREDIRSAHVAVRSSDRRARSNALEFLDALAVQHGETLRALLRLMVEDLTPRERAKMAKAHVGAVPNDAAEALRILLGDNDHSLAALAAYDAYLLGDAELIREVHVLVEQRNELSYVLEAVSTP